MKKIKVLVANRAEIACRVFQACREMGLEGVGIVAPGDEDARHVTYADRIERVDGYLDIPSVIKAAQSSGATLIHPGYGFLSERPAFVEAVEKAGLTFVGPTAETMSVMGGKISAKELVTREGLPTLPWAKIKPGEDIKIAAKTVGFPLLLKASAGGGGKGMRLVRAENELEQAADSASREAVASFGDGTLFIERFVEKPRHIEVQVFGDGRGGGVHLHERECSLQRRHQKVWEEATAPHLSEKTRLGLFAAAMKLVAAVKYRSAGTLEFLVDDQEGFYFLEMNTRLQVEHPVTELVTGVDLVWAQLAQALAPEVTILSDSPQARGHAIEVRLYAEDPANGFMPTPGKVERLKWPTGPGIRVDSGIEEGQVIGTQFDSMVGKLIVHASNRDQALARMKYALEETVIHGLGTNLNYLQAIAAHPLVRAGRVHTGFLGSEFAYPAPAFLPSQAELALIAATQNTLTGGASTPATANGQPAPASPWVTYA